MAATSGDWYLEIVAVAFQRIFEAHPHLAPGTQRDGSERVTLERAATPNRILPMPILPSSPSVLWRPNRETETALSRVPPHFPHRSAAPRSAAGGGDYGLAVFVLPPIATTAPPPPPLESIPFPSVRRRLKEGREGAKGFLSTTAY